MKSNTFSRLWTGFGRWPQKWTLKCNWNFKLANVTRTAIVVCFFYLLPTLFPITWHLNRCLELVKIAIVIQTQNQEYFNLKARQIGFNSAEQPQLTRMFTDDMNDTRKKIKSHFRESYVVPTTRADKEVYDDVFAVCLQIFIFLATHPTWLNVYMGRHDRFSLVERWSFKSLT